MKVAVTGSTGFVGGALAKRLLDDGHEVRLAGRRVAERVPKLVEAGGTPVEFDLTDPGTFEPVVDGVEVLFHVAAWVGTSPEDLAVPLNVTAVEAIVRAAGAAGVRRVVLVSTVAVYDLAAHEDFTKEVPVAPAQDDLYGATKAQGEAAAFAAAEEVGVGLVAIRPGQVYGPGSRPWTLGMFKLVNSGTPALFGAGDGHMFPVYIDNLVDGLVLAATADGANGERLDLVDRSVTWAEYLGRIGKMAGKTPRRVPLSIARLLALASEKLPLGLPLDRTRLKITQNKFRFDSGRPQSVLGWTPSVDLEEGMARSEAWLREIGRLGDTKDPNP